MHFWDFFFSFSFWTYKCWQSNAQMILATYTWTTNKLSSSYSLPKGSSLCLLRSVRSQDSIFLWGASLSPLAKPLESSFELLMYGPITLKPLCYLLLILTNLLHGTDCLTSPLNIPCLKSFLSRWNVLFSRKWMHKAPFTAPNIL